MPLGYWFWIILVFSVIFGGLGTFGPEPHRWRYWGGFGLVVVILFVLVGLRVFNGPVQ